MLKKRRLYRFYRLGQIEFYESIPEFNPGRNFENEGFLNLIRNDKINQVLYLDGDPSVEMWNERYLNWIN